MYKFSLMFLILLLTGCESEKPETEIEPVEEVVVVPTKPDEKSGEWGKHNWEDLTWK